MVAAVTGGPEDGRADGAVQGRGGRTDARRWQAQRITRHRYGPIGASVEGRQEHLGERRGEAGPRLDEGRPARPDDLRDSPGICLPREHHE